MIFDFNNRNVLVVGAGRGIGQEIVRKFLLSKANVYAIDIDEKLLSNISDNLQTKYLKNITAIKCDVTDYNDVKKTVKQISDKKRIEILVYCAGGTRSRIKTPIEKVSNNDWKIIQDANVTGCFYFVRSVVPSMKKNKNGRIIVISSRAGIGVSLTGIQSYGTAKAAQIGFVKQLSSELGKYGITVNSVAPGFMPTSPDYIKQWKSYGKKRQLEILNAIAMKRIGKPEDIANAVMFFSSEQSGFITGQTLAVTGSP